MANFDPNSWYQVTLQLPSSVLSLASNGLRNGAADVYFQLTDTRSALQQWQIFSSGNDTYVIRSAAGTSAGCLTTTVGTVDNGSTRNTGGTVPHLNLAKSMDKSILWVIKPWRDGSFWMANLANGTDWHLGVASNGLGEMSSNTTAPQVNQAFIFNVIHPIDDTAYSTIPPLPTSIVPTSPSTAGASRASATANAKPEQGFSRGESAGLAVGVAFGVLAFFIGILLIMKRRRSRCTAASGSEHRTKTNSCQGAAFQDHSIQRSSRISELEQPAPEFLPRAKYAELQARNQ